jgi:ABC-type branched-subunit amino acid transport system substrate-binding protein
MSFTGGMGRRFVAASAAIAMVAAGLSVTTASVAGAASSTTCAASTTPTASQLNSTVGVTKKSITVGNISIISGPVPGLFQGAPDGVKAYFAYVNSQGGVNGRKLILDGMDDGFSGTQNQSEATGMVAKDFAEVGSFSLFDNYSCNVLAQNSAVSDVSVTLDPGTNSLPNVFSAEPLEQGAPLAGYQMLAKKYGKSYIQNAANLVSDSQTALANWQGQEYALQHLGYKFTYVRQISPLDTNFTTDIINMKNAGVKMVYLTDQTWQSAAAMVKEAAQQNFHPIWFSGGPVYDPGFIAAAGGPQNVNGTWFFQVQALYNGQDAKVVPAVKTFDTWMAKVNPGAPVNLYSVFGWGSAQLFVQALKAAGPNPTRGKVLAALKQITSFSASNVLAPANPAKKLPPNCTLFGQIQNGKFVRIKPTLGTSTSNLWNCSSVYYSINGPLQKVNPSPSK